MFLIIFAYRVSYGYGFAGPNGSGFLPLGMLDSTTVQESLRQMQELMYDIRSETLTVNQQLLRRVFESYLNHTMIMSCK